MRAPLALCVVGMTTLPPPPPQAAWEKNSTRWWFEIKLSRSAWSTWLAFKSDNSSWLSSDESHERDINLFQSKVPISLKQRFREDIAISSSCSVDDCLICWWYNQLSRLLLVLQSIGDLRLEDISDVTPWTSSSSFICALKNINYPDTKKSLIKTLLTRP